MNFKNMAELKRFLSWAAQQKTFQSLEVGGVKVTFNEPSVADIMKATEPVDEEDYKDTLFHSGSRL